MDKIQKFGRNSRRIIKRFMSREVESEDLNLNFTTRIHHECQKITWRLENFVSCPLVFGEYHQSPPFYTGFSSCTRWALRMYPKGRKTSGKVGFYIIKESSSTKVSVQLDVEMEVSDVENAIQVFEKKNILMNSEADEFGFEAHPPCNNFLRQESVKIICVINVGYLDEVDDTENCTSGSSTLCSLSVDMKEMYSNGKFSDMSFQVGKKQIPAHKAILAARSKYFAAMFEHPMEESQTNVVDIQDVELTIFSDLLHYIYSGKIDNLTVDKAMALFPVADKYMLEELQKWCVRVILANLCEENACRIAIIGDMHSEPKLKAAANHCFRQYKHQIFERKEWKRLINVKPHLATEILQNVSSELNSNCKDIGKRDL